jgi:hypothetical protein
VLLDAIFYSFIVLTFTHLNQYCKIIAVMEFVVGLIVLIVFCAKTAFLVILGKRNSSKISCTKLRNTDSHMIFKERV